MLETLYNINWAKLEWSSANIPKLITDLTSDNLQTRRSADLRLGQTINHQGDVYDTTYYAIPFLIELLQVDEVQSKDLIMSLLYGIMCGAKQFQKWKKPWGKEVYDQMLGFVPFFKEVMGNSSGDLCVDAADLLCHFDDKIDDIAAWINARMDVEPTPLVRVGLANALGNFSQRHELRARYEAAYRVLIERLDDSQSWFPQFKAAVCLMDLERENVADHVLEVVVEAISNLEAYPESRPEVHTLLHAFYLLGYELRGYRAVQTLLKILPNLSDDELVRDTLSSMLNSAFELGSPHHKLADLSPLQRLVLETLVGHEAYWEFEKRDWLWKYGLPYTCRELLDSRNSE